MEAPQSPHLNEDETQLKLKSRRWLIYLGRIFKPRNPEAHAKPRWYCASCPRTRSCRAALSMNSCTCARSASCWAAPPPSAPCPHARSSQPDMSTFTVCARRLGEGRHGVRRATRISGVAGRDHCKSGMMKARAAALIPPRDVAYQGFHQS